MVRALVRLGVLQAGILLASPVQAIPYWFAWEGNDFPENQGWERMHGPNGAQAVRTLNNGLMTIDGIQGAGVYDTNFMDRPGMVNPGLGERFIMRWRVRVDDIVPSTGLDPGVAVLSDDAWIASFVYYKSHLLLGGTSYVVQFQPDVFHTWEFRSDDMRWFDLYLDGALALRAGFRFHGITLVSRVGWGDVASPSESRSTWDYFRYGVVPEPHSVVLLALTMAMARPRWPR
jgi:hypothetical protein